MPMGHGFTCPEDARNGHRFSRFNPKKNRVPPGRMNPWPFRAPSGQVNPCPVKRSFANQTAALTASCYTVRGYYRALCQPTSVSPSCKDRLPSAPNTARHSCFRAAILRIFEFAPAPDSERSSRIEIEARGCEEVFVFVRCAFELPLLANHMAFSRRSRPQFKNRKGETTWKQYKACKALKSRY